MERSTIFNHYFDWAISSSQTVSLPCRVTSQQYGWKTTTRDECYGDLFGSSPTHFGYRNAPKWGWPPICNLRSRNMMTYKYDDQRYDFGAAIFRQLSQANGFIWRWIYRIVTLLTWDNLDNLDNWWPKHRILWGNGMEWFVDDWNGIPWSPMRY